jgi:hypothetical protein
MVNAMSQYGEHNQHVLPDSRLSQRPEWGCFMGDWQLPDGATVRIEIQPIFCANCGVLYANIPRDNTDFAFALCNDCFWTYGRIAGTYAMPDDEFNKKLAAEMQARYGRDLTHTELALEADQGTLGPALEALRRDAPYSNEKQ